MRQPTNREDYLMRLLSFSRVEELEDWLNAPSELPLGQQLAGPEEPDDEEDRLDSPSEPPRGQRMSGPEKSEDERGRKRLEIALTVCVAVLLLVASQGRYPYGFYMLLRLAATVGAVYWAIRVYHAGARGWLWAFATVGLLMNPFVPIRMSREDWQPIDLVLGILLLGWVGYWSLRKKRLNV